MQDATFFVPDAYQINSSQPNYLHAYSIAPTFTNIIIGQIGGYTNYNRPLDVNFFYFLKILYQDRGGSLILCEKY